MGYFKDTPSHGPGIIIGAGQNIYEESATAKHDLGERFCLGDRTFFYASAGEQLYAGNLCEAAPFCGATTTLQNTSAITVASPAGSKRVYVNAVTTAQSANVFADGYAAIYDATTTGKCWLFRIKSHTALATTGTASYLTLYDELPTALTTDDQVSLMTNMYKSVAQGNTTVLGAPVGIAPINVTSAYYFWLQTYGPAAVYPGVAAFVHTEEVVVSDTTAGSAEKNSGADNYPRIGYCLHVGTVSEAGIVFLTIRA